MTAKDSEARNQGSKIRKSCVNTRKNRKKHSVTRHQLSDDFHNADSRLQAIGVSNFRAYPGANEHQDYGSPYHHYD
jgi:hypothetical protein